MYILHQGVNQSAQDSTFCIPARAMKEYGAMLTKYIVMAEEARKQITSKLTDVPFRTFYSCFVFTIPS